MKVGTLGPALTNSEKAAEYYIFKEASNEGEVQLYTTPELSIEGLKNGEVDKVILCVVYPKLNDIVFKNLDKIRMSSLFHFNTMPMVIAEGAKGSRACSHPAPVELFKAAGITDKDITLVDSNSKAAQLVKEKKYDLCVTTLKAAEKFDLKIIKDFGEVPMGWAVFERV